MEKFNGFPSGELQFTPVPDLFFARLVPQIDSLVELKLTLHFMWVHYRETRHLISKAELLADDTLAQSLALIDDDINRAVSQGLERAVQRGTLLQIQVDDENGEQSVYALNSQRGRQAYEKLQAGDVGVVAISSLEVAPPSQRRNIFELYEDNISLISPIIADELKDAEATYPAEWIEEAFKIAVENNVRRWSYIRAVLERMATGGRGDATSDDTESSPNQTWFSDDERSLIQR